MRDSPFAYLLLLLLVGSGLLSLTGCNPEKQKIESELQNLAVESDQFSQKLSDQQSLLEATKQRLNVQSAQLEEYNASVLSYIAQHQMAVFVVASGLAGADTALDPNNQYSEQTKEIGGIVTAVAVFWAASHMDEVSEVFTTLNQADAHARTMKADIAQTSSSIRQQTLAIQQTEQGMRNLTQKTALLQHQRDEL